MSGDEQFFCSRMGKNIALFEDAKRLINLILCLLHFENDETIRLSDSVMRFVSLQHWKLLIL